MTIPNFSRLCQRLACAVVPLVAVWTPVADAQVPAQLPLLSRAGAGVQPNLMLLMDDSGSMGFRHMPETVFASDTFITTNPVQSNGIGWELTDTYQRVNFQGTVPGIQVPPNYVLPALRSPDTNTIYYNPEIRYQPWFNDDGVTRRPNAPVTTAYLNPPLKALTATSTTSNAIAIGSKTFTLAQTGKGIFDRKECSYFVHRLTNHAMDVRRHYLFQRRYGGDQSQCDRCRWNRNASGVDLRSIPYG